MIDVIISSKLRPLKLLTCVDLLFQKSLLPEVSIIVVVDSNDPESITICKSLEAKYLGRLRYVISSGLNSNVKAYNTGVLSSSKKYVFLMADDGYMITEGWDAILLDTFNTYKEYKCIYVPYDNANGRNYFESVKYPFSFIIDRELFLRLGLFDERFVRYGADTHFGMSLLLSGDLFCETKNVLIHHLEENDELKKINDSIAPLLPDNLLFHSIWDSRKGELQDRLASIGDVWGKIV